MWLEILRGWRDGLAGAMPDTQVSVGADAQVPECRAIQLLRGPGDDSRFKRENVLEQRFWIECWAYDKAAPEKAYADLDAIEQAVRDYLTGCSAAAVVPGWDLIVTLEGVEPDGDQFRPSVGSRMTVLVKGRKQRNTN